MSASATGSVKRRRAAFIYRTLRCSVRLQCVLTFSFCARRLPVCKQRADG